MVARLLCITAAALVACSNNPSNHDAQDAVDSAESDAADLQQEESLDQDHAEETGPVDALDGSDHGSDHAEDLNRDMDTFEPTLTDCNIPVRDCFPGCRQVTCAAPTHTSWSWDIYNSIIAYYSRTSEYGTGLYVRNLETEEEIKVAEYTRDFDSKNVSVHANKIAYKLYKYGEASGCKTAINIFDLNDFKEENLVCYTEDGRVRGLDIFNNIIVWYGIEDGEGNGIEIDDLFMFDLDTMEKTRLTRYEARANPMIWGRQFVFDGNYYGFQIFLWDLDTMDYRAITDHPSDQWQPDIWQNRVVWIDHRNGPGDLISPHNCDIYWCELPDCESMPATTNWAAQECPTIGGDWIAWIDYRNDVNPLNPGHSVHDQLEIWGYNISTGEEYQLVAFEDTVLWGRLRIENDKLYFIGPGAAIYELDLSIFL